MVAACTRGFLLGVAFVMFSGVRGEAQTVVMPGPGHTLEVQGEAFFPLGWMTLGVPSEHDEVPNRASVRTDLVRFVRQHGGNFVFEPARVGGRILPRRRGDGRYNYVNVEPSSGFPRPGAFVEGMKWLLSTARQHDVYVMVDLQSFVSPLRVRNSDLPNGYDWIGCEHYAQLIEAEKRQLESDQQRFDLARHEVDPARISLVDCRTAPERLPYWEWNLRYVVQSLRDEVGLLAWLLFDEPVNPARRFLFGEYGRTEPWDPHATADEHGVTEEARTADLLYYAYERVIVFETEGGARRRHPIVVDEITPRGLVSRPFEWSERTPPFGGRAPGPFDVREDGHLDLPADILVNEGSSSIVHTQPSPDRVVERYEAYTDQNRISRTGTAMMMDIAGAYDLWAIMHLAQAQLPDGAWVDGQFRLGRGFAALYQPLRVPRAFTHRTRLLNDRDIVWQVLTPLVDGARGIYYYERRLVTADSGRAGREMARRIDRFNAQIVTAEIPQIFMAPSATGDWSVPHLSVEVLTDYYRSDPVDSIDWQPEPGEEYGASVCGEPGRCDASSHPPWANIPPSRYVWGRFSRYLAQGDTAAPGYGHAVQSEQGVSLGHADFRLLRTDYRRHDGHDYVFLSNAYDARIRVTLRRREVRSELAVMRARFDLGPDGHFSWEETPSSTFSGRLRNGAFEMSVSLEPYEAAVFRLRIERRE